MLKLSIGKSTMLQNKKTVMYIVKATITHEEEENFNEWYNKTHCPQLLQFEGVLSAKRYKSLMGEDYWQYLAVYEFESEDVWRRFMESDHLKALKADYDLRYGRCSDRGRFSYEQIWP